MDTVGCCLEWLAQAWAEDALAANHVRLDEGQTPASLTTYIWSLDGPIRANRFADSRESPDLRELPEGSRTEPFLCKSHFGGLKKCESQV